MNPLAAYNAAQTPEQRENNLALARQATKDAAANRLANEHLYTLHYMDSSYWQELALSYNIRMPISNQPCTIQWMRKYLKRLNIVRTEWLDACGITHLQRWIDLNPKHTLYAFVGNLLEYKNEHTKTHSKTV